LKCKPKSIAIPNNKLKGCGQKQLNISNALNKAKKITLILAPINDVPIYHKNKTKILTKTSQKEKIGNKKKK
jgi:hypothetical protein